MCACRAGAVYDLMLEESEQPRPQPPALRVGFAQRVVRNESGEERLHSVAGVLGREILAQAVGNGLRQGLFRIGLDEVNHLGPPGFGRMPCSTYITVPSGGLIWAISTSMVTTTPNQIGS